MDRLSVFGVLGVYLWITVAIRTSCYATSCNDLNIATDGSLQSGVYSIDNNDGDSFSVYCQFFTGYGYTFISNATSGDVNITLLMDDASHVIIRHKRLNGNQYTSTIKQLDSFSSIPISVQFNRHEGYKPLFNIQMTPYVYFGFIPISHSHKGNKQGWSINKVSQTFTNCDDEANSYFACLFNHNNTGYKVKTENYTPLMFSWYSAATEVLGLEYIPDEFFTSYYEVHHGGCGGFSTSTSEPDVTGVAVGIKFLITCGIPSDTGYGNKSYTDTNIGSTVMYFCNEGYAMVSGDSTRTCTSSGSWSGKLPICKELVNVAEGKQAYQSDTYCCDSGDANLAIDGGVSQFWQDGTCSLTESKADSYWGVDLGDFYIIDNVIILARIDPCCDDHLRQVELYTGTSRTFYNRVAFYAGVINDRYTFHMNYTVHARWVKVTRLSNVDEQLSLCEVKVIGYKPSSLLYRHEENMTGTGNVISESSVRSKIDCCRKCFRYPGCLAVNLHINTSMCFLLDSNGFASTAEENVVFFLANYKFE